MRRICSRRALGVLVIVLVIVLAVLATACTSNPTAVVTPAVTAGTGATQTPAVLPTYTIPPTYTPQPTYTPYPTHTQPPAATATFTPVPPTATLTPVPATATLTPAPPTATFTPAPPTATRTATRTRTPLPCTVSYATVLHVGGKAVVQNDNNHNVRSQPQTAAAVLGQIGNGHVVDVLDGPVCGNDMWWWYVRSTSTSLTGWTAEAGGGVRWLANYAGCTSTTQRITFPAGGTSYKVVTTLSAGCTKSYVLRISAGQNLGVSATGYPNPGLTSINVYNPFKAKMSGSGAAGTIWYHCVTTGDYTITIAGTGAVQFDIFVPPL